MRARHTPLLGPFMVALLATTAPLSAQTYDLVLRGGRVVDPESGLDAVRNVGIRDGRVAAVATEALAGREVVDVTGLVVAPGFIDLHAHGQDAFSRDLQVRDGVTTALELEGGVWPVADWYGQREGQWRINFGATVSHGAVRYLAMGEDANAQRYERASREQIEHMQSLVTEGLRQGAIGVGFGIQYVPGASREEIYRLFKTVAAEGVAAYVHVRYAGVVEPESGVVAIQELIANAGATGASVHIVHIGSSGLSAIPLALEMIDGAQASGLDVTTEVYPYAAASTDIASAIFDPGWRERLDADYGDIEWVATGERLDSIGFYERRAEGGPIVAHIIPEDGVAYAVAHPGVIIASDGVPFVNGRAHPRGAGSFARVLGRYVREEGRLSLAEAVEKMTLLPARRLETVIPEMRRKGRISVGADADLTIFDPATVRDRASFAEPAVSSDGIPHVLVGGVFVVRDGTIVDDALPGQAIRQRPIS